MSSTTVHKSKTWSSEEEQCKDSYNKVLLQLKEILQNYHKYKITFIVETILKIGRAHLDLNREIKKLSNEKTIKLANKKNKELGIYAQLLRKLDMHSLLLRLIASDIESVSIKIAALQTLAVLCSRPNKYRNNSWYDKNQNLCALNTFSIQQSDNYHGLLLLSHILKDQKIQNQKQLQLKCQALRFLWSVCNQNSVIQMKLSKYGMISDCLKLVQQSFNQSLLFMENNDRKSSEIAFYVVFNGLNSLISMLERNHANRINFMQLNGLQIILQCLKHNCLQIRLLAVIFIQQICSQEKLLIKYLMICTKINDFSERNYDEDIEEKEIFPEENALKVNEIAANSAMKTILELIEKISIRMQNIINDDFIENHRHFFSCLLNALTILLTDHMIGYHQFLHFGGVRIICHLMDVLRNILENDSDLNLKIDKKSFLLIMNQQILALLACFEVQIFEDWVQVQYRPIFEHESDIFQIQKEQQNDIEIISPKFKNFFCF